MEQQIAGLFWFSYVKEVETPAGLIFKLRVQSSDR